MRMRNKTTPTAPRMVPNKFLLIVAGKHMRCSEAVWPSGQDAIHVPSRERRKGDWHRVHVRKSA